MIREMELPYLTSQTSQAPKTEFVPDTLRITYDYDFKVPSPVYVTITFERVLAFRYTDETSFLSPIAMIGSDIVESDEESSIWLQQLRKARERTNREGNRINQFLGDFSYKHFGISLGEWGIFEVVAERYYIDTRKE